MISLRLTVAAFAAMVGTAIAQTPPAQNTPGNSAVQTPNSPQPAAPVAGANSFTEAQAKARIESQGYSEVSGLAKDDQGVWRGKATKGGASVDVSLDFQGNVVTR